MVEGWVNDAGEPVERRNRIPVEVLGRDAQRVGAIARIGMFVTIEGYLRSDQFKGQTVLRIRTLSITVWEVPVATREIRERSSS